MIKYRKAKKKDWNTIKYIVSLYPKVLMQAHVPSWSKFYVAENNSEVIGCCALDIYSKRIAEIRSLAVLPDFHGKGIGNKLVEICLKKAKGRRITEIITITSTENFFHKFGFSTFNNEKIALFKIL